MSNFSQYFPIGSSGGGGIPINGYFPFTVSSTSTTGYNATTGLYTHPDGTFWLRSGTTLIDTSNAYPSATEANSGIFYTGFNYTITSGTGYGAATNPTNGNVYFQRTFPGTVTEYTSAGVATGFSFTGGTNPRGIARTTTNFYEVTSVGGLITEYTTAGVATGFSFNIGVNTDSSLTFNGTNLVILDSTNNLAVEYTTAGVATGFSFSVPSVSNETGIVWDSNNNQYWVSTGSGTVVNYDSSGVAGSVAIATSSTVGRVRGELVFNASNNTIGVVNRSTTVVYYFNITDLVIGDATTRTDTDSAQPLFVRIG